MTKILIASITLLVAGLAVYTDVRWAKIFNVVTVPAILLGLILNSVFGGIGGLVMSLQGIGIGLGVFLLTAFLGRILGGGDIKLFIALGALQGPTFLLWTIAATAGAGAVLAIVIALYNRILISKLKSLATICYLRAFQKVPMQIDPDAPGPRLPYAIAIAIGAVVVMAVIKL